MTRTVFLRSDDWMTVVRHGGMVSLLLLGHIQIVMLPEVATLVGEELALAGGVATAEGGALSDRTREEWGAWR